MASAVGAVILLSLTGSLLAFTIWAAQTWNSIEQHPLIVWLKNLPPFEAAILMLSILALVAIAARPKPRRRRR